MIVLLIAKKELVDCRPPAKSFPHIVTYTHIHSIYWTINDQGLLAKGQSPSAILTTTKMITFSSAQ